MSFRPLVVRIATLALVACGAPRPRAQQPQGDQRQGSRPDSTKAIADRATLTSNAPDTLGFNPVGTFDPEMSVSIGHTAVMGGYDFTGFDIWVGKAEATLRLPHEWSPHRYDCPNPVVSPDTLDLRCPNSPLGTIVIRGHFLDKHWHVSRAGVATSFMAIEATASILDKSSVVWSWHGRFFVEIVDGL